MEIFLNLLKSVFGNELAMFIIGFCLGALAGFKFCMHTKDKQIPSEIHKLSCPSKAPFLKIEVATKKDVAKMVSCPFFNKGTCKKDNLPCELLQKFI